MLFDDFIGRKQMDAESTNWFEQCLTTSLIARNSIEQSEENLRLNEQYYKAGTFSMSDLLQAQQFYQQICDKYAEAYSKYEISKTEYLQATGR